MNFPDIDTSYWKTKDPEWMAARKAAWPRIEKMLTAHKSGKGKTAIKNYFLRGKLPDWDAFANWDNYERHVDLFILLWLHPSWAEELLTSLRNAYIVSDCIVHNDLAAGFGLLMNAGVTMASQDYTGDSEEELGFLIDTQGHNELLFRVMMGNLEQTQYELVRPTIMGLRQSAFEMPKGDIDDLFIMGKWLCVKNMHPLNNDMLFQYDLPLEWWYRGCPSNEKYFAKAVQRSAMRRATEKALWRIHHFDDASEGPGPRTTFVTKMRRMLDERPFISEIKEMWLSVKAGEIQLDDPWNPLR